MQTLSKYCAKCKDVKSLLWFHKNRTAHDGLQVYCIECSKKLVRPEQRRIINSRYTQKHSSKIREKHLRYKYGVSLIEFNEQLLKQNGLCAICRLPTNKSLHVDHDHESGKVRGLLCNECNHGIGNFRDNAVYLARAIEYLNVADKWLSSKIEEKHDKGDTK